MPQLTIWDSFSKKQNSTKRPTTDGWTVNAALKENTSLSNPTFILAAVPPIPSAVNYALFEGRYYYVTDIVQQSNHRYELHCTVDPLATYRDAIAAHTTFVERAASEYDNRINDNELSQRQDITHVSSAVTDFIGFNYSGTYVVRTISGDGIIGYALSASEYADLVNYLFDDTNFEWSDLSDNLTKTFFNPFQYIVSVKWFPFTFIVPPMSGQSIPVTVNSFVKFGWWTSTITAKQILPGTATTTTIKADFGCTPQLLNMPTRTYTDFRAYNSSYSNYQIYIPGCGTITLDAMDTEEPIYYQYDVDLLTGSSRVFLSHNSGTDIISEHSGTMGIDVQIGQLKAASIVDTAIGGVGGIVSLFTGNVGGGINSLVNTVQNVTSPKNNTIGSSGNRSAIRQMPDFVVTLNEYGSAAFPQSVAGRPLYQNRQLGTLSGFVKCGNASIDLSGFTGEREAVNSALNSGFYME